MTLPLLLTLALTPLSELETEIRSYDLRLATPVVETSDTYIRLLPALPPPEAGYSFGGEDYERSTDDTVGLLYQLFEQEFEYEGRWIAHPEDDLLIVNAPASVHAEIARVLAFMEQAIERSLELELNVVDLPASRAEQVGSIGSRISDGRARQLIDLARSAGRHEAVTVRVRPGQSTTVDLSEELSIVRSFGIEIAQQTVSYQTEVEPVSIGTRLTLRASARPGGARVMMSMRGSRQLGGIGEFELAGLSQITTDARLLFGDLGGRIQTCEVMNRSMALATFVPTDEVVAIALHDARADHGGRRWVLMRLIRATQPTTTSLAIGEQTLQVYDLERIAKQRWAEDSFFGFGYGGLRIGLQQWDNEVDYGDEDLAIAVGVASPDYETAYDLAMMGDDEWVMSFGPWNVTARPKQLDYGACENAAASDEVHDLSLRLTQAGEEVAFVRLSVLDGEDCIAIVGTEKVLVGDLETEVAQGATACQPDPRHVFDGLAVRTRAKRSLSGRLVVDVSVRGHLLEGEVREFDTGSQISGVLQNFQHRNLMLSDRVVFDSPERSFVLGDSGAGLALEVLLD